MEEKLFQCESECKLTKLRRLLYIHLCKGFSQRHHVFWGALLWSQVNPGCVSYEREKNIPLFVTCWMGITELTTTLLTHFLLVWKWVNKLRGEHVYWNWRCFPFMIALLWGFGSWFNLFDCKREKKLVLFVHLNDIILTCHVVYPLSEGLENVGHTTFWCSKYKIIAGKKI